MRFFPHPAARLSSWTLIHVSWSIPKASVARAGSFETQLTAHEMAHALSLGFADRWINSEMIFLKVSIETP
jgi:hypothetical protein